MFWAHPTASVTRMASVHTTEVDAYAGEDSPLQAATLCGAFQRTARLFAGNVALRTPDDGVSITWEQYAQRVERLAGGLAAHGVQRGDTVGIMLVNRPEFNLVDSAALHLGATPFSVYNTSVAEQIAYLFANASNRVVVTERQFLPAIREALAVGIEVEHIVLVDGESDSAISLQTLEASGDPGFDFAASWRAVQGRDIATLIYTSGTTGPPKGVQLTHTGLMAQMRSVLERIPTKPGGRTTSFLPSAHLADRWFHHYQCSMALGFTVTCIADPRTIIAQLSQREPTPASTAPASSNVIGANFEVCVNDVDQTIKFYRDALGFAMQPVGAWDGDKVRTETAGTPGAQYRQSRAQIPGTNVSMAFIEFKDTDRKPLHTRVQDPGTAILQLRVRDVEAMAKSLSAAGATIVSEGGHPVSMGANKLVLVRDLNNLFLELLPAP